MFPLAMFAELAKTEILGWLTQLGIRISFRFGLYATVPGFPSPAVGDPFGAARKMRSGAAFPLAVLAYTVAV